MEIYVIEFTPPMDGLTGSFNTFRLGKIWASRLARGDRVLLLDKRKSLVFAAARVRSVKVGALVEMAKRYAHANHNQKDNPDKEGAAERLIANMRKRYGPHIATDNKSTAVIALTIVRDDGCDS